MTPILRPFIALLALALSIPGTVRAAQSQANCTGFIESLPTTISTQGVWCLRRELSTGITAGNAVTIATNNVTLDCNDFRLGGLGGGDGSEAIGIRAEGRLNATVRNCRVRGFRTGVRLEGRGHVVENNRVDSSSLSGIHVDGDAAIVRGNMVSQLRTRPGQARTIGILALGAGVRVLDNDIGNIRIATGTPVGIHVEHGIARDNRITELSGDIHTPTPIELVQSVAEGNLIALHLYFGGTSIQGDGEATSICRNNLIAGHVTAPAGCAASGNVMTPYPGP